MHVNFDRRKKILRAEFVGQDVSTLVNYLKPFRNNAPVGEWLGILEPLCAPVVEAPHVCRFFPITQGDVGGLAREGCSCGAVKIIEEETDEETNQQEEMQAEAISLMGGKLEYEEEDFRPSSDDEISHALYTNRSAELPQVTGHTPEELDKICSNCSMPQWRHIPGSGRCQANGQVLGTMFRERLLLKAVEVDDVDDGAVFAVTVGESEVRCG